MALTKVSSAGLNINAGLPFPATAVAVADSNTLDDYEEGTFTPTLLGASGEASYSGTPGGHYTKIGRMVYCAVALGISGMNTLSGTLRIGGLPFTVGDNYAASALEAVGTIGFIQGMTNAVSSIAIVAYNGTTTALWFMIDGTGATDITESQPADIDDDMNLRASITYCV